MNSPLCGVVVVICRQSWSQVQSLELIMHVFANVSQLCAHGILSQYDLYVAPSVTSHGTDTKVNTDYFL